MTKRARVCIGFHKGRASSPWSGRISRQIAQRVAITGPQVATVVLQNHTAAETGYDRTPFAPVAIDISKHRHEVRIRVPQKTCRRRMTILNTLDDFQRFSAARISYDLPVRIGFEATGNSHRPLARHLGQAGFDWKPVSSVGLARTREALDNSWDKKDPKDAQVILHMREIGTVQFFHDRLVVRTADIQAQSKTHEIASRSKTELWQNPLPRDTPRHVPR